MRIVLGSLGTAATAVTLALALTAPAHAKPHPAPSWEVTTLDPDQNFRGLEGSSQQVAWVSGESRTDGSAKVFRTVDGGENWAEVTPPDTVGLSFRDVEATGADTAHVLAIGPGEASRIYRTTDGGSTWTEVFRNTEEAAFYNCMDFYPGNRVGLAMSDPVDGHFRIARTTDSGRTWRVLTEVSMPAADGEAGFSASGDCLTIRGRTAWFGSGGDRARVFTSTDLGRTWSAADSGIDPGPAAGVFALAAADPRHLLAVGGDFAEPADGSNSTAYLGRRGWTTGGDLTHPGEDVSWLHRTAISVGEYGGVTGSSLSRDGGRSWTRFSDVGWHTVECTHDGACWAAGGDGRVGRLDGRVH